VTGQGAWANIPPKGLSPTLSAIRPCSITTGHIIRAIMPNAVVIGCTTLLVYFNGAFSPGIPSEGQIRDGPTVLGMIPQC